MIDFNGLKDKYRENPLAVLKSLVGSGKIKGNDYVALNPKRKDGKLGSFKIDISSGKFHDFATGDSGGSIIDLAAFVHGCGVVDAAQRLQQLLPLLASTSAATEIVPAKKKKIDPAYIWNLSQIAPHTYTGKKKISIGNAKVNLYKGKRQLVVPLTDSCPTTAKSLQIKGLQFINENGEKFFPLPFKGLFHIASDYRASKDIIVIAEGYATARSIAESTDFYVIAAMSSCNLKSVVVEIARPFRNSKIIIAADNDEAGRRAAEDAKQAVGASVVIVYPTHGCNDLYVEYGADAVKDCFKEVLHG